MSDDYEKPGDEPNVKAEPSRAEGLSLREKASRWYGEVRRKAIEKSQREGDKKLFTFSATCLGAGLRLNGQASRTAWTARSGYVTFPDRSRMSRPLGNPIVIVYRVDGG